MSVRQYWDVWCDDESCAQWCDSATANTKARARENAIKANWTYTKATGDRCPDHSPQDEASRRQQQLKRAHLFAVQKKADQENGIQVLSLQEAMMRNLQQALDSETGSKRSTTPTERRSFLPSQVTITVDE